MTTNLNLLTQDELFSVLRGMLKHTQNECLPNIEKNQRVKDLYRAILPSTWKAACEKHFDSTVEQKPELDAKTLYLDHYSKKRFTA